jgi:post-segregation antitoxin (ccd killing protein)
MNSWRKTVGITLPQNLIEKARKRNLNISRITEQALNSILDYLEIQNSDQAQNFLINVLFQRKLSGRAGI